MPKQAAARRLSHSTPNHHFGAVGPMTGMTTRSQPLMVVENKAFGNRAYCAINEGLGKVMRFGGNDAEVLGRLHWMRESLGPGLSAALRAMRRDPAQNLIARGLTMGDEMHQRNVACSSLFLRQLAPCLAARPRQRGELVECLDFIGRNDQFFLNIAMAMGKALTDPARNIEGSSVVTAMSRNGTDFGIRVSATGDRWFTAPVEMPAGIYFPGLSASATPIRTWEIRQSWRPSASEALRWRRRRPWSDISARDALREAACSRDRWRRSPSARNPGWTIPAMDFAGVPTGIDIRLVVETGLAPNINTGIAHREPGVGQVGAGIVKAPLRCFERGISKGWQKPWDSGRHRIEFPRYRFRNSVKLVPNEVRPCTGEQRK